MAVTTAAVIGAGAAVGGAVNARNAGKRAAGASRYSAELQAQSAAEAREQAERLNAPYLALGESAVPGLQQFIDDPTGASYLASNPLFGAAVDYTSDRIENRASAGGRLNSGGTVEQLFQNYLAQGDRLVNSGFQRALAPVQLGQNAANFQGANSGALITDAGAAQAAGVVGAANATNSAQNQMLGFGAQALGSLGTILDTRTPQPPSPTADPYDWRASGYGGITGDPFAT